MHGFNAQAAVFGDRHLFRTILRMCPALRWTELSPAMMRAYDAMVLDVWDSIVLPLQETVRQELRRLRDPSYGDAATMPTVFIPPVAACAAAGRPGCNPAASGVIRRDRSGMIRHDWMCARMLAADKPEQGGGDGAVVLKAPPNAVYFTHSAETTPPCMRMTLGRCVRGPEEVNTHVHVRKASEFGGFVTRHAFVPSAPDVHTGSVHAADSRGTDSRVRSGVFWRLLARSATFLLGFPQVARPKTSTGFHGLYGLARPFKHQARGYHIPLYIRAGGRVELLCRVRSTTMVQVIHPNGQVDCPNFLDVVRRRIRGSPLTAGIAFFMQADRRITHAHEVTLEPSPGGPWGRPAFVEACEDTFMENPRYRASAIPATPELLHALCVTKVLRLVVRMRCPSSPQLLPHLLLMRPGPRRPDLEDDAYFTRVRMANMRTAVLGRRPHFDPVGVHLRMLASSPLDAVATIRRYPPLSVSIGNALRLAGLETPPNFKADVCRSVCSCDQMVMFGNIDHKSSLVGAHTLTVDKLVIGMHVLNAAVGGSGHVDIELQRWVRAGRRTSGCTVWDGMRQAADVWMRVMTLDLERAVRLESVRVAVPGDGEPGPLRLAVEARVLGLPIPRPLLLEHLRRRLSVLWCVLVRWFLVPSFPSPALTAASCATRAVYLNAGRPNGAVSGIGLADGHLVQQVRGRPRALHNSKICCMWAHSRVTSFERRATCRGCDIPDSGVADGRSFVPLEEALKDDGASCAVPMFMPGDARDAPAASRSNPGPIQADVRVHPEPVLTLL